MSKEESINHWFEAAERDSLTADDMYKLGHYSWSLFLWHLVIEKIIKCLIVKKGKEVLLVHDLVRLASIAELSLTEEQKLILREITTFNIEARYDDYKEQFYKKATREYAAIWRGNSKEMYKWIKEQL